jgi:dihydrofolate synthase / folylpolyglutamate synthase
MAEAQYFPAMTMNKRFAGSEEVFAYYMGFVNVEKGQKTEFKLDRMRDLCAQLGHPEAASISIHVAGSKGKGSVSTMIARILEAAGRRSGLYTSPHLLRWKERISLAGDEMPEEILVDAAEELRPLVEGKTAADFVGEELPTYFELTTLTGFLAFRRAACDRMVLETGMGGRLDSTNVAPAAASVITPIELEHTEWLGDTIPKIAFEKAGIIKPGKPCYISRQRPEAREVFERACAERGCELFDASRLAQISELEVDSRGTEAVIAFADGRPWAGRERFRAPLVGAVQAENMALAILAAASIEPDLDPETARRGLARAVLPARFQVLALDPPVVLDGAHTPLSTQLCLDSFNRIFPGPAALLFACAYDKKHEEMAAILRPRFAHITVTRPGTFKQSYPEKVAESFGLSQGGCRLVEDTQEAVRQARAEAAELGLPLLIAGSFYLCSEAAKILE